MAEGAEPKTSFAPSSGRSRFLDPETLATWKAKRRVRSPRLKSVTDFYEEPEARNRSNGAVRGAGNRALRAKDRPQTGRVRHPQGPGCRSISYGPVALDPIQANDSDALAIQRPMQAFPDPAQAQLGH